MLPYKFIFSFIIILMCSSTFAQQTRITGKVLREDSSPAEYANVSLLKADSTFLKGVNTDMDGFFALNNDIKANCLLSVSYLGYETTYTHLDANETNADLGEIILQPASVNLDEALVTAQSVINKADRKLITPTKTQVESSTSGLDLLQKLQLPRINIDYINNKITASGNGTVQLRINGVEVTHAEIVALRPEEIVRIEYHDDPGLRYGNAAAVLDYIVRRRESGGNINANGMHGVTSVGFTEDYLSAKYNNRKSEFSANSNWRYRKINWVRTNDESFIYPDEELHRIEKGLPTMFKENQINTSVNYSLLESDKYYFNARFRYNFSEMPNSYSDRKGELETSYNPIPLTVTDHSEEKYNTPVLDLYYQHHLKNDQLLIFNVVGTYISSTTDRHYTEFREDKPVTDITSYIKGDKYSIIAEGVYERNLGIGKLSTGLKYKQTYANNKYSGTVDADVSMKQAENYLYVQYQFKKGKFNYMAGVTGSRFYYSQGNESQTKFLLQPSVRVNYTPSDNAYVRYRFNLWSHIPSLGELNNVQQDIDSLQIRRGNPYLKSGYSLNNQLTAGYNKGIFGVDLYIQHTYRNKPVMESIYFEDGKFVRTSENQKGHHHLNLEATFKIKPWKEYLSVSLTPGINRYISEGNDYLHTYTNKYIRGQVDLMYKEWVLSFMGATNWDWFFGESMNEGEKLYTLAIGYNQPKWSIMFGGFNPFGGDYKRYEENWSKLVPSRNEIFTNDIKQMFFVKASINIDFGRQFKSSNRRLNNEDSDAGIMSGAKK